LRIFVSAWLRMVQRRLSPSLASLRQAKIKVANGDLSSLQVTAEVGQLLEEAESNLRAVSEVLEERCMRLRESQKQSGAASQEGAGGAEGEDGMGAAGRGALAAGERSQNVDVLQSKVSALEKELVQLNQAKAVLELQIDQLQSAPVARGRGGGISKSALEMTVAKDAVRLARAAAAQAVAEKQRDRMANELETYLRTLQRHLRDLCSPHHLSTPPMNNTLPPSENEKVEDARQDGPEDSCSTDVWREVGHNDSWVEGGGRSTEARRERADDVADGEVAAGGRVSVEGSAQGAGGAGARGSGAAKRALGKAQRGMYLSLSLSLSLSRARARARSLCHFNPKEVRYRRAISQEDECQDLLAETLNPKL
jgi:hypothetical protein